MTKINQHISLKDLANELNISVSTVSRALRDHWEISEEVIKKVKDLACEWGYRPNPMAISLTCKTSQLIGVIVPDIVTHFYSSIINGIEDVAQQNGYYVIITSSRESFEKEVEGINNLLNIRVCGILICLSSETDDYNIFKELEQTGTPTVFFDRVPTDPNFSRVISDNFDSSYRLTSHLIENGYNKIAFTIGSPHLNISQERRDGYIRALQDNEIEFNQNLILDYTLGSYNSSEMAVKMFDMHPHPDAIICMTDTSLYGTLMEIKRRQFKIPHDIAIAGFTDELHSQLVSPSLTVITHPTYEIGSVAARRLIDKINRNRENHISIKSQTCDMLKCTLIINDSTAKR